MDLGIAGRRAIAGNVELPFLQLDGGSYAGLL
jgi:hypothetical protein